ncbi:MAG: CDP-diacylglycerol--serine O-phosphatidyltransferase, partial [Nitratireductor sp.]|nr:CDP-diacylglycerol--serine O-phosphatidyltransferase [Nitratireductor sp.]
MEPPFPPFVPDEDEAVPATNGQPRLRDIPLRVIFPNVLTLLAIASGLTAIRFAIENRPEMAIGAIILAAVLDGIDGRVARFLKSTSRFGAQMDSLADFVNFGVAPGMIIYFTFLGEIRTPGWIAVIVYAICACLRLARFNVQLDQPKSAPWRNDFFTGVPAPAGAMVVLLPAYLSLLGVEITGELAWITAIFSGLVGMLMVSNLPTYSGKTLGSRIPSNIALPVIIGLVLVVALLLSYPWQVLTA